MIINLNESYRLHGVPMNIVLEKKLITEKGDNAGKEYWIAEGYYPNIESALKGIFNRLVETSEAEGIQLLIQEIKSGVQAIIDQINILKEDINNETL